MDEESKDKKGIHTYPKKKWKKIKERNRGNIQIFVKIKNKGTTEKKDARH